jgi:hypothetical protein
MKHLMRLGVAGVVLVAMAFCLWAMPGPWGVAGAITCLLCAGTVRF